MARLVILLITTLCSLSMSAQNDSIPRMAIIESDTVALLTLPQVKKINLSLIDLQMKTELIDELTKRLATYQSSLKSLEDQNSILCQTEEELHRQINKYKVLYEVTDEAKVKAQRDGKRFKLFGYTIAIAGIVVLLFK